jgi:hypothetical protein
LLEKNVQSLYAAQMSEQSKGLSPGMWAQFMNTVTDDEGHDGAYVEQSKTVFTLKCRSKCKKQNEQLLSLRPETLG